MGRQVNFYINNVDQIEFDNLLKSLGDVLLVPYFHFENKVSFVNDTIVRDFKKEGSRIYLLRPQDKDKLTLKHINKFNYWLIDDDNLPAIQFERCLIENNIIYKGRLYFKTYFPEEFNTSTEYNEFIKWAEKILNKAKRYFVNYKDYSGNYVYTEYISKSLNLLIYDKQAVFEPTLNKIIIKTE